MATHFGFADVSVWCTLSTDPRPAALTFGVAADGKDANQVWTAVKDSIAAVAGLRKVLTPTGSFTRVRVSHGQDGSEDVVYDMPMAAAGTGNINTLPPNCAVLVHKRTQRGGRRGRGRLFIPWCVSEGNVGENGVIDSSVVATLQTTLTGWFVDLEARGVPMYLLHQDGQTSPGLPTKVTSLAVDPLISTQRRRLHR